MNNLRIKTATIVLLTALTSGCSFHVDKGSNADTIYDNTQTAKEVCGGSDRVKSVALQGFTCKAK